MIFIVLLLAVLFRPHMASVAFVGCAVLHSVLAPAMPDQVYYLSAALADLFVVRFIASLDSLDEKAVQLQALSLLSLVLNFAGWATWYAYIEPLYYNAAIASVYLLALAIITQGGGSDGVRNSSVPARLYGVISAWRVECYKFGATI